MLRFQALAIVLKGCQADHFLAVESFAEADRAVVVKTMCQLAPAVWAVVRRGMADQD